MKWGLLLGLVGLAGCVDDIPPTGEVSFAYQLRDGAINLANCTSSSGSTAARLRLDLGDDGNDNGLLDEDEVRVSGEAACNQSAALGSFGPVTVAADSYELLAVQIADADGNLLPWLARSQTDFDFVPRHTFAGPVVVVADQELVLLFEFGVITGDELVVTF